jgi:hypothetical protein
MLLTKAPILKIAVPNEEYVVCTYVSHEGLVVICMQSLKNYSIKLNTWEQRKK